MNIIICYPYLSTYSEIEMTSMQYFPRTRNHDLLCCSVIIRYKETFDKLFKTIISQSATSLQLPLKPSSFKYLYSKVETVVRGNTKQECV